MIYGLLYEGIIAHNYDYNCEHVWDDGIGSSTIEIICHRILLVILLKNLESILKAGF